MSEPDWTPRERRAYWWTNNGPAVVGLIILMTLWVIVGIMLLGNGGGRG